MIVPFFRWKLDLSILLRCDIIPFFLQILSSNLRYHFHLQQYFWNWRKFGKVCLQMLRNFEVRLDVAKQLSTLNLLHESFFAERSSRAEICSKMIFYCRISSVWISPIAIPQFLIIIFVYFLLDIFFAHLVLFPLFYPSHNFVVSQWRASFLTWTEVEITIHCFRDSVLIMVTNSINTKAINRLLSKSNCNIALNITFWTSFVKKRKHHIFERTCFVQSRHEFLRFRVIVPSCIQSSRH